MERGGKRIQQASTPSVLREADSGGFTLIELLAALAVLAVLLTITFPAYHRLVTDVDGRGAANAGQSGTALAQLQVLVEGEPVALSLASGGLELQAAGGRTSFLAPLFFSPEANVPSWTTDEGLRIPLVPPFAAPAQGGSVWLGRHGFVVRPVSGLTSGRLR